MPTIGADDRTATGEASARRCRAFKRRMSLCRDTPGLETNDQRLAKLSRALRRRERISQRALATRAAIPREDVIRLEAGRAGEVRTERIRKLFDALGARIKITVWWLGAAADRLLDERHAWLVERAITVLRARGWLVLPEVTFSEYGERGSIDILAGHAPTRSVLIGEVKGSIGSTEETNRSVDIKERLAKKLAFERFGWWPETVSRVLIVPEDSTVRQAIDKHRETFTAVYSARSRESRAWLRQPNGRIAAIWFLSEVVNGDRATPSSRQQLRKEDR
jgi:transcriptional regulator with XRE-family HTH domain